MTRQDKRIWRLMEANCNEAEISAYYGVSADVARVWMLRAKRAAYAEAVA